MQRRNTLRQAFGQDPAAAEAPGPTPQAPGPTSQSSGPTPQAPGPTPQAPTASSSRRLGPPLRARGWALAAYSRLVPGPVAPRPPVALRPPGAPRPPGVTVEARAGSRQSAATWMDFECSDKRGKLLMSITESGNLSVMDGETALEQFSIYEAPCMTSLCHVFQKEECVFFSTQVKTAGRTFRVKLYGETKEQALEQCSSCVMVLSNFIRVHKMAAVPAEKQGGGKLTKPQPVTHHLLEAARPTGSLPQVHFSDGTASMSQLAKLTSGAATAPFRPLASLQSPNFPAQQLGPLLRLCVLDPNFIALVERVEQELTKIIAEDP
ncbi:meiotic recombination protein REC114 [Petromyzon marinus]|uniref:meiotic recombination protein REC114 n=1 Tax=Petromyzon marinus TaxID=7757 RepID=UPI003F70C995